MVCLLLFSPIMKDQAGDYAIFIYVRKPEGVGEALANIIGRAVGQHQLTIFASPAELTASLRTALHNGDIVIVQADQNTLAELLACQEILEISRLILILTEINEETIAMAHRLRPRFLTGLDDEFLKVSAVLGKMLEAAA